MEPEVRRLPKKTIIIMIILVILGVIWFFLVAYGQSAKVEKILYTLNYKNVSDVKVYAYHKFVREDINTEGFKYTVSFTDNDKKESCKGFVLKDFKRNVTKDLICTKIGK